MPFFKSRIKVAIREGIIYLKPSNLNNFFTYGKVLFVVYYQLFQILKAKCNNSKGLKFLFLVILIGFILVKILLLIQLPSGLFWGGFIWLEFLAAVFLLVIFFNRLITYLLFLVGFHIPVYVLLCAQYKNQAALLKLGIVQFSWLFEVSPSFEWISVYLSVIWMFSFLIEYRVDMGFCEPAIETSDLDAEKNSLLLSALFLFALTLRIIAHLECPWVFFWCASCINIEMGCLALGLFILFPFFSLFLASIFLLWFNLVISTCMLGCMFCAGWKMFCLVLLSRVVAYHLEADFKDFRKMPWNFIPRLFSAVNIIFIISIMFYLILSSFLFSKLLLWELLLEPEKRQYLNLAVNLTRGSEDDNYNRWWLDKAIRTFLIELNELLAPVEYTGDESDEDVDAPQFFKFQNKKYPIIRAFDQEYIFLNGKYYILIQDKFDFIRLSFALDESRDSVANMSKSILNLILSTKIYAFETGLGTFMGITQLFCVLVFIWAGIMDKKYRTFNLSLGLLICVFIVFDYSAFWFQTCNGGNFGKLLVEFFLDYWSYFWFYLLAEIIYAVIQLALKLFKLVFK